MEMTGEHIAASPEPALVAYGVCSQEFSRGELPRWDHAQIFGSFSFSA